MTIAQADLDLHTIGQMLVDLHVRVPVRVEQHGPRRLLRSSGHIPECFDVLKNLDKLS
jgi:hypothetical protein